MTLNIGAFFVGTAFLVFSPVAGKPAEVCNPKASDIVFVLDSSSSIWPHDFVRQLSFVEDIVSNFDVGPLINQTRIGIITFSHTLKVELYLKDNWNISHVISAIRKVRYLSGGTSTSKALSALKSELFLPKYGAREQVRRIAIVITDGMSYDLNATKAAAEAVKDTGVSIFAIGVGRNIHLEELETIANSPPEQYVYQVANFMSLEKIKSKLSDQACQATFVPDNTTAPPGDKDGVGTSAELQADSIVITPECGSKPADVYFLLDSSSSIRRSDHRKQLEFVKDVVAMFYIGKNKTRIGVSTFSHSYRQEFNFQAYSNKDNILRAIGNISRLKGGTYTAAALRNIRLQEFKDGVARQEVTHILVVITDGFSRDPEATEKQAQLLHQMGVYVFAVGVTGDNDLRELKSLASKPSSNVPSFLFDVYNFDALDSIKKVVAKSACNVVDTSLRPGPACHATQNTDVIFLLDSSSLGESLSSRIIQIIQDITRTTTQLKHVVRIRYGVFGRTCSRFGDISLSKQLSFGETIEPKKTSELALLINKSRSHAFPKEDSSTRKLMILFLYKTPGPEEELEIKKANSSGIEVVFITIGDTIYNKVLQNLVNGQEHILNYDPKREDQIKGGVVKLVCKGTI